MGSTHYFSGLSGLHMYTERLSAKLTIRQAGEVAVMDISGRITLGEGSSDLRERMRELVALGHRKILLNLDGVTFVDSSGIGELVSGYVSVANLKGKVRLAGLSRRVRDLFLVTKLYDVLEIHETEEQALRAFG